MKRKRSAHVRDRPPKKARDALDQSALATTPGVEHPVLRRLYPDVFSLRHYLLSRLSVASKNRHRKISQLGKLDPSHHAAATRGVDMELGELLDSTLVGVPPTAAHASREEAAKARDGDIVGFSQQLLNSTTGGTFKPGYFQQSETVDFVIWRLFKRSTSHRPSHLLCHGFQRGSGQGQYGAKANAITGIPGLVAHFENIYVHTVKGPLWCRLHAVLGEGGDRIMMDLLLDCGIFYSIEGRPGNYYQLSGIPISEIKYEPLIKDDGISKAAEPTKQKLDVLNSENRKPSTITFVRSRMLYARAALNAKGGVRFGMRHIHVLNRFPNQDDDLQTVHIMRYIFPRQFGLHNVFTSKVDMRETSMPFKDYTLREKEIQQLMCRVTAKNALPETEVAKRNIHVPKRLRGATVALVDKLRNLHRKCSYMELLRHYCPVEGLHLSPRPDWRKSRLQPGAVVPAAAKVQHDKENAVSTFKSRMVEDTCFTDMACPTAHVSAFCRAVIAKVIPNDFWGEEENKRMMMYWIDQFLCLRRFESLTLHQITQKLQISTLAWLRLPGQHTTSKMVKSDIDKRREIFMEFVYWVFDSFLIPLVRSNFHVTESNVHRNRLFYFRHDVWRMLTEPSLLGLRVNTFEEMPAERAAKLLSIRPLGFSKIRLLPKHAGVRLITNLKRRQQVMRNGSMILGRSINSVMAPVFNAINFEKSLQPSRFGCSLFSVSDMFPKLAAFRSSLQEQGLVNSPLYFAKVDVQSCFDTIPQKRLLSMVESLLSMEGYQTGKHVEIRPLGQLQRLGGQHVNPLPLKRYVAHGGAAGKMEPFDRLVRDKLVGTKANTVFVDTAMQHVETKDDLMQLLREHVERNLVKIGKRFYRQKTGIPQGSVLSSILCNFFYAELEREALGFALGAESLLLRLLDDFCLITIKHEHAEKFVKVMHRGNEDYGVKVKAAKSLANFDMVTEDGYSIPKSVSEFKFPYCGVLINTRTLEVSKDTERSGQANVADSLTIDLSKVPGQTFHRKALNGFKIQLQAMFIDTSFNTVPTVLANLYQSFREAAVRCFAYNRSLSKVRPTHSRLLIKTIDGIIALAYVMLQRRTRAKASQNVERVRSIISRRHVQWLACKAFEAVFQRRQTQHCALLAWLRRSLAAARPSSAAERSLLEGAAATWRAGHGGDNGDAEAAGA
ncbi:hypothetical protein K505DRAFT_361455 [Melanomma pulvis-pyrius CBS 109.77]|uniref:Telomerase reverse transcriptase n=1 Tax=Melanomma pulvis-pyrius CBS 109.77 TaxID=1314802 RepID=A0A6A6XDR1_9PLEO|nr:hypothetical protein K505DRAFT_361455 [Melanomma pulvis-pyrius CBS 109.77]